MSTDDPGRPPGRAIISELLTLTEAAARTGYSRVALRQRVRRGSLAAQKGNDGQLRVRLADLADLPPPDAPSSDDQGRPEVDPEAAAMDVMREAMADLRDDLGRARTALDEAHRATLADRGRAERAEAQAAAEQSRREAAETRARDAEAALAEARTPLVLRIVRALRG